MILAASASSHVLLTARSGQLPKESCMRTSLVAQLRMFGLMHVQSLALTLSMISLVAHEVCQVLHDQSVCSMLALLVAKLVRCRCNGLQYCRVLA